MSFSIIIILCDRLLFYGHICQLTRKVYFFKVKINTVAADFLSLSEHGTVNKMKGPREEPEMSQNFSSGVNCMWRLLTSHSFHP